MDFYKDEERCGFLVPELMKRCWAAEMEVLKVVIDICTKNGITYFADWGTLLGAIRHEGFIPWDDDIDISVKRADYNKLIEVLNRELPKGFAVTGMHAKNDKNKTFLYSHTRVATIGDEWEYKDYLRKFYLFPFNVAIDIFPLDYVARDQTFVDTQRKLIRMIYYIVQYYDTMVANGTIEEQIGYVEKICNVNISDKPNRREALQLIQDQLAAMCTEEESDYLTIYPDYTENSKMIFRKEWFSDTIIRPFENMEISVPKAYDEILTTEYGDYMKMVRGGAVHEYPCYKQNVIIAEKSLREQGFNGSVLEFTKGHVEDLW